jgi:hypothetical protein
MISNADNVKGTYGLLVSDQITKANPGLTITKNPRYMASCRLRLPFEGSEKETVCFEAGPTRPGQASYRLEFNPSKLSKAGLLDLMVFLESTIDAYPLEFFRGGKVTRCDLALDFPGLHLEDVIVRSARLQKHGLYSDRYGAVETTYLGTPKSSRIVAYARPVQGGSASHLRLERRLKPRCLGHVLANLEDPFARVALIPADFVDGLALGIPGRLLSDSIRIGGVKRVLQVLNPAQRKALKKAYQQAESVLHDLHDQWAAWPDALISCGLGKELGALPVMVPGSGSAINCNPTQPDAVTADIAVQSTALDNQSEGTVQPCP